MKKCKLGLIGSNINYSLSPKIFGHPTIQAILPSEFTLINLNSDSEWLEFWNKDAAHFDYLCVTTPWKRKVFDLALKEISPEVATSKTANWIKIDKTIMNDIKFSALNTDYFAFQLWWKQLPKLPEKIYYLGYGASSFTFYAMVKSIIEKNLNYKPKLYIVTRDLKNSTPSGCFDYIKAEVIDYSTFYQHKVNHQTLLVNGSLYGQKAEFPIELTKVFEQGLVWDLNYAQSYRYISFYQKSGFEFLVNQALCFLASQNLLQDDQFPELQKELLYQLHSLPSKITKHE